MKTRGFWLALWVGTFALPGPGQLGAADVLPSEACGDATSSERAEITEKVGWKENGKACRRPCGAPQTGQAAGGESEQEVPPAVLSSGSSAGTEALPWSAGSSQVSPACQWALRIHACQVDGLDRAEKKLAKLKRDLEILAEVSKKAEGLSAGIKKDLEEERAKLEEGLKEAGKAFGPEDSSRLAALREKGAELEEFCTTGGDPDPIYSLRLGAEGILAEDASAFRIDGSSFTADLYFSQPLARSARMTSVQEPDYSGVLKRVEGERKNRESAKQKATKRHTDRKADYAKATADLEAARALLLVEENRQPRNETACCAARSQVLTADAVHSRAAKELQAAAEDLDKADRRLTGVVCDVVAEIESTHEASRDRAVFRKPDGESGGKEELFASTGERSHRFGPFAVPRRIDRATKPYWGWVRLRWEKVPLASLSNAPQAPADGSEANGRLLSDESRLSATLGLAHYWALGRSSVLGATAGFGWYFGSLALSSASTPPPDGMPEHVTWEGGLLMQTKYRVADLDKSAVAGVVGQVYLGYRRMNHLRNLLSADGSRWNEADRFVADFTLSFKQVASGSVQPLVYATLDKSLRGHENRDRVGVLLDVSLDRVFGPLIKGASATVTPEPKP